MGLVEEAETEQYLQEYAVTSKKTELLVQDIENEANEILNAAYANSSMIEVMSEASADKIRQLATFSGWNKICDKFSLTQEDHKLSMLFIRTLSNMDNLVKSVGFDERLMYQGAEN